MYIRYINIDDILYNYYNSNKAINPNIASFAEF